MRPIRGASDHSVRFPHHRCAYTNRAAPGIHASTTSAARSYRNRLQVRSVDAMLGSSAGDGEALEECEIVVRG
jgi:hypothetical protein